MLRETSSGLFYTNSNFKVTLTDKLALGNAELLPGNYSQEGNIISMPKPVPLSLLICSH